MNVREKLVELLADLDCNAEYCKDCEFAKDIDECVRRQKEIIADRLIAHGVTVQEWVSIEAEELQNYIGVPACIKRKTDGECWWAIIRGIKGDKVSTDYDGYFKLSEYGETWIVKYLPLPQPPKENEYE